MNLVEVLKHFSLPISKYPNPNRRVLMKRTGLTPGLGRRIGKINPYIQSPLADYSAPPKFVKIENSLMKRSYVPKLLLLKTLLRLSPKL